MKSKQAIGVFEKVMNGSGVDVEVKSVQGTVLSSQPCRMHESHGHYVPSK